MSDIRYEYEKDVVVNSHFGVNQSNRQNLLARQHYSTLSEDLKYLNIFVANRNELNPYVFKQTYNENRNVDLFQNDPSPSNYALSVIRATINAESIPLYEHDANDDGMEVRLTAVIAGITYDVSAPIVFISNEVVQRNTYVQNVTQWVNMVNSACRVCYDALLSAAGLTSAAFILLGGPNSPPTYVYTNDNNFQWQLPLQYESTDVITPNNPLIIKFYFNQLFNTRLMNGFNVKCHNQIGQPSLLNQWQYELLVNNTNNGNFSAGVFTMKNLHFIYDNLIEVKKIIIGTTMAIDSEQTNGFYRFTNEFGDVYGTDPTSNNSTIPVKILLDLNVTPSIEELGSIITYQPAVYRYFNINSDVFNVINWTFLWSGADGILRQCYLPYGQAASIKFLFTLR